MTTRLLPLLLALWPAVALAYPIDGYEHTGIKRLEYRRLIAAGDEPGRPLLPGQMLPLAAVAPGWRATDGTDLPPHDAAMSRRLASFLDAASRPRYAIAVIDLSDPLQPRYASHNPQTLANAGSVGKILVALALLQTLADLYPEDLAARERVLRDTVVTADAWSQYDHHTVPFYDPETRRRHSRQIRVGDRGTLWEYLDWMMSASSNSAAAMVQKELIALAHFGARYPVPAAEQAAFFADSSQAELGAIMQDAMNHALERNGLDPARMRQGSFFTRTGNQRVRGTSSYATPEQLARFLLRLEAGTLVDEFSSREIKRLLYMTQRRIRYASHPALNEAAVYFKSGSYYQCHSGPRGCRKYAGDKTNRLGSVAIVESPAGAPVHRYLVVVMSNVLSVNSAVAHQTLAMRIHRMIEQAHPVLLAPPPLPETDYPVVPVDDSDEVVAP
jgi:hypothetical protein